MTCGLQLISYIFLNIKGERFMPESMNELKLMRSYATIFYSSTLYFVEMLLPKSIALL